MKVKQLIEQLKGYEEFEIKTRVRLEVMEEELQKRIYGYPHDLYCAEFIIDDIGYSDKEILIGIEIIK